MIQEGEILPVGEIQTRPVNVRIIASTNRDLEKMVENSTFRQDLFFRLNVFSVKRSFYCKFIGMIFIDNSSGPFENILQFKIMIIIFR